MKKSASERLALRNVSEAKSSGRKGNVSKKEAQLVGALVDPRVISISIDRGEFDSLVTRLLFAKK